MLYTTVCHVSDFSLECKTLRLARNFIIEGQNVISNKANCGSERRGCLDGGTRVWFKQKNESPYWIEVLSMHKILPV